MYCLRLYIYKSIVTISLSKQHLWLENPSGGTRISICKKKQQIRCYHFVSARQPAVLQCSSLDYITSLPKQKWAVHNLTIYTLKWNSLLEGGANWSACTGKSTRVKKKTHLLFKCVQMCPRTFSIYKLLLNYACLLALFVHVVKLNLKIECVHVHGGTQ